MRRRRQGIAIIMAMLISTLMVVMLGAFFQVNRDNLNGYTVAYRQKQAYLAAMAGQVHARLMIEHDQNWGKSGLKFSGASRTLAGDITLLEKAGTTTYEGTFLGARAGQSFTVDVYNNLGLSTSATTIDGVQVAGDAVKFHIIGRAEGFESRIHITYTGEPLYDSSAISQGELDMSRSQKWILRSKDPRRNWVRSNTGILTPDIFSAASAATSPMLFDNQDTGSNIGGVAWSRGDIQVDMPSGPVNVTSDLAKAQANTKGLMAPKSSLRNDIYKMSRDDLKLPTTKQSINPGRYVISDVAVNFETPFLITDDDADDGWFESNWGDDKKTDKIPTTKTLKTLTYFPPSGAPVVYYETDELNSLVKQVATEATAAANSDPSKGKGDVALVAPPQFTVPSGMASPAQLTLNTGFDFNFDDNTFSLDGDKTYEVNGDFEVGYNFSSTNTTSFATYRPKVVFKGGTIGSTALSVNGTVDLSATVEGKAAVAASGDITFMSGADATATVTQPLVVYSGGSINIVATSEVQNDFLLKGLIYADKDFNLLKEDSATAINEVMFQGSIVAQSGKINMGDANQVSFMYDPAYIEAFTHGLPQNRRRLKQAAFVIR